MSSVPSIRLPRRVLIAVIVIMTFALIARSWLQLELEARGIDRDFASDVAFLVMPPILLLMLAPVLRGQLGFLAGLFQRQQLTLRLVLTAVAVGVLMRLTWWSKLVAGGSFGILRNNDPLAVIGPAFVFECPAPVVLGLGLLVMAVLVPLTEEILHRGVIQSALVHRGPVVAIGVSAVVFTAFHTPSSYAFVFLFGIVLGIQFWCARTLWATLITHATYNALIQFDWRCLQGQWNPPAAELPLTGPGIAATGLGVASLAAVLWLVTRGRSGAPEAPRS